MPGSSSWIPYVPQGVKGLDDDDDVTCQIISRFSPKIPILCEPNNYMYCP